MIRPTLRGVALFGATVPLALVVLAADPDFWPLPLDLGLFALALIGIDALRCVPVSGLDIACRGPSRLFIGTTGAVDLAVRFKGERPPIVVTALAEQQGEAAAPEPQRFVVDAGEAGGRAALPVKPLRRGRIAVEAVWLRWTGPMGLAFRTHRHVIGETIDVVPDVRGIASAAIEFFTRDAVDGIKVQFQKGEGVEFEALREHTTGLDNRFIDWKRSAKHLKLLSKEFRTERNHQVILAYDTGYLLGEPIEGLSRLDHAIHAGLLLGWVSLRGGDYVGTFGFDARVRQFQPPVRGLSSFARLQNASGRMNTSAEETNFTLGLAELNARLKRRALVVLFTEFIDTTTAELLIESLTRIANRHAVIFVTLRDPLLPGLVDAAPDRFQDVAEAVIAHDLMRERAIVLERLARLGIHCLEMPPRGLSVALVNRYLTIKQRGLL